MISYCPICGKPVYFAERKRSLGKDYHPLCLKCYRCKRQLCPGQHAEYDEKPYCNHCYLQHFGPRGARRPASRTTGTAGSNVPVENPST
ncbi:cysteine-rich protein 2-like [Amblyraja radiata]|uniref:cysteine-rich protein 2-like n=1 Tax=Amblyraja radiata TaxID=386614 RepID=UPI001403AA59|nr:cysteine-rich protein 2-like [Amblyraja radiata]XP_055488698.1 cysteine-rich protein 2 [Leucoraja erinacea]